MRDRAQALEKRLEIPAGQAVPVKAVPGTVVQCERGLIWLTQDAMWRDIILIAGAKFVSASDGKIVLSAPDGDSVARVYAASGDRPLSSFGSGLHIDYTVITRIEREARLARWAEFGSWFTWAGGVIASAWHHLAHRQRHAVAGK
jgi:hypothetical protein